MMSLSMTLSEIRKVKIVEWIASEMHSTLSSVLDCMKTLHLRAGIPPVVLWTILYDHATDP
jgi:hypothetical protein